MPNTLNKCFPFHLPVSKVGILPATEDVGSLYKPSEDHYDIFSNRSPNSARGTVKSANSSSSDPIDLPRVSLHKESNDEQRRQSVNTRVASTTLSTRLAMPSPPQEYLNEPELLVPPSSDFSVFCVMTEAWKADKSSPTLLESQCQSPKTTEIKQREYVQPYKLTPILPYDHDVDDDDDDDDDVSVLSLGLDVFNKPLPGDVPNRFQRLTHTKLPKLMIHGKKKPAQTTIKTPRPKDAKDNSKGPPTKQAWSNSIKKERKRLKHLTKLSKFSERKLPEIKTTKVMRFDPSRLEP
ncbi:uncharacterized protein LOC105437184 [Strongylocentrotus purpuratus]|uniref:Uncharacterized protein n=1 Tax=Strongylocentrotus purpuratus TaxID=7668 RepID=A0A7M7N3M7_STRPU|nr:uncharacterized protein LOC105437184 [Strongylocentrotus purpuratus]